MKYLKKIASPITIILFVALLRLFPHPPNFAPVGAMALFGGVYLSKRYSIVAIISTLLISDYFLLYINPFSADWINFSTFWPPQALFHSTTVFVYASFVANILIGWLISKNRSLLTIGTGSLASSLQFFLVTNFAVWAMGAYARGFDGLIQSYIMGLPFFGNTLLGDAYYTVAIFGAYELALYLQNRKAVSIVY